MDEMLFNLLTLIHRENEAIMTVLLRHIAYPEDYEKIREETINSWEESFMTIINASQPIKMENVEECQTEKQPQA